MEFYLSGVGLLVPARKVTLGDMPPFVSHLHLDSKLCLYCDKQTMNQGTREYVDINSTAKDILNNTQPPEEDSGVSPGSMTA